MKEKSVIRITTKPGENTFSLAVEDGGDQRKVKSLIERSLVTRGRLTPVTLSNVGDRMGVGSPEYLHRSVTSKPLGGYLYNINLASKSGPVVSVHEIKNANNKDGYAIKDMVFEGSLSEFLTGVESDIKQRDSVVLNNEIGVQDVLPYRNSRFSSLQTGIALQEAVKAVSEVPVEFDMENAKDWLSKAVSRSADALGVNNDIDSVVNKLSSAEVFEDPEIQVSHAIVLDEYISLVQENISLQKELSKVNKRNNESILVEQLSKTITNVSLEVDESSIERREDGVLNWSAHVSFDINGQVGGVNVKGEGRVTLEMIGDGLLRSQSFNEIQIGGDYGTKKKGEMIERVDMTISRNLNELTRYAEKIPSKEKLEEILRSKESIKQFEI